MDITGRLPRQIIDTLNKLDVVVEGIQIVGNDIDVTLTQNGESTTIYAVYTGNGRWEVSEIDDNINLFPDVEPGDIVTSDLISKLFINSINSSLILSFNPLGRIKYGIKDIGAKIGDVAGKVADWATDNLKAQEAEDFIRKTGKFQYQTVDPRDNKKVKKEFNATGINLGKLESLGKKGHFKALSGNPKTQDFQVWHLYKNGNKIRCLTLIPELTAEQAQEAYDLGVPEDYVPSEEDNVTEEPLTDDTDFDDEDWYKMIENIQSSLLLSDFEDEGDNVIEEPKRKSKYNGCNVTGCTDVNGDVALA